MCRQRLVALIGRAARRLTIRSTGPIAAGRHLGYKSLAQMPARRNGPVSSNVRRQILPILVAENNRSSAWKLGLNHSPINAPKTELDHQMVKSSFGWSTARLSKLRIFGRTGRFGPIERSTPPSAVHARSRYFRTKSSVHGYYCCQPTIKRALPFLLLLKTPVLSNAPDNNTDITLGGEVRALTPSL